MFHVKQLPYWASKKEETQGSQWNLVEIIRTTLAYRALQVAMNITNESNLSTSKNRAWSQLTLIPIKGQQSHSCANPWTINDQQDQISTDRSCTTCFTWNNGQCSDWDTVFLNTNISVSASISSEIDEESDGLIVVINATNEKILTQMKRPESRTARISLN